MIIKTKVYKNEDISKALKRLRRKVQKEGVLQDLFDRRFYKSKGLKAREMEKHSKYICRMQSLAEKSKL